MPDLFRRISAALASALGLDSGTAQMITVALFAGVVWFVGGRLLSLWPGGGSSRTPGRGERLRRARKQSREALARGDSFAAAKHLELAGDTEGARRLREKAALQASESGEYAAAATHLEALGRPADAARLLVKARRWREAASLFRDAGRSHEAARALEQAGQLTEAAKLFLESGRLEDAMRVLERMCASNAPEEYRADRVEHALQAARLAKRLHRPGRAAELLEIAGKGEAAARLHAQAGHHARAAQLFEAAGAWADAAEAFRRCGDGEGSRRCGARAHAEAGRDEHAGELFAAGEEWQPAAECFARAGLTARAAECFERLEAWSAAAEWHEKAGDERARAECHERAGEHWDAARCWHGLGEAERALECYGRVGHHDEHFLLARGHSGALHAAAERHAAARTLLEQVVAKLGDSALVASWMPEWLEALAGAQEGDGDPEAALESWRRLALIEPTRPGVSERIEELSSSLRETGRGGDRAPDRYQVLQELAAGGMGRVYLARDVALERFVALKMLSENWRSHPELRERFLREAKVAAKLSHPNVVAVHDVGEDDGRPYMALEYVEGRDLSSLLREKGRLEIGEAVPILEAVANALGAAHAAGIVHRDVKPGNVFLREDGAIKLGDFGIARIEGLDLTETGMAVGTPRYMAPEQACGKPVDGRTDIYALGVLAFHLLTGRPPFVGGDLAYKHVHEAPPDPRQIQPDLPPLLAQLILSCLAKKPELRPPSAERFASLLEAAGAASPAR